MIATEGLSQEALKGLRSIKKMRKMHSFCDNIGINPRTFKNLLKNGYGQEASMQKVEDAFNKNAVKKEITIAIVIKKVAQAYGIPQKAILSKKRDTVTVEARQVAVFLIDLKVKTNRSAIAKEIGYRDNTAVTWTVNKISERLDEERDLKRRVYDIRAKLEA